MKTGTLEVKMLTKRSGNIVAVDLISFSVGPGEVFGVVRPNDAGRTTAIKMLRDLLLACDTGVHGILFDYVALILSMIALVTTGARLYPTVAR